MPQNWDCPEIESQQKIANQTASDAMEANMNEKNVQFLSGLGNFEQQNNQVIRS